MITDSLQAQRNPSNSESFKFQHPTASTARGGTLHSPGSRATSIKAEPSGSALESNASDKAQMGGHKVLPRGNLKAASANRLAHHAHRGAGPGVSHHADTSQDTDTSTSSSMYSLLKSSEDFGYTGESSTGNATSDEDNKVPL